MYKLETHAHTSEASSCASAAGEQQAEQYKALGYDGLIITDHFFNGNTAVPHGLPWVEKVELYCAGFENAKKRGDEIGLNVMFGIEYGWHGSDFLAYGIDKKWLLDNPDLMQISVHKFCDRVHENGGIIVQAHPFRDAFYIKEIKLLPKYCDGVEVYNAGNREDVSNERALWYADQFSLTHTAGGDCHHIGSAVSGVLTEIKIESIADYCDTVRENKISGLLLPDRSQQ